MPGHTAQTVQHRTESADIRKIGKNKGHGSQGDTKRDPYGSGDQTENCAVHGNEKPLVVSAVYYHDDRRFTQQNCRDENCRAYQPGEYP